MKPSPSFLVAGLLVIVLPLYACTDRDPVDVEPEPIDESAECLGLEGTLRSGEVSGRWTRDESPHVVMDTVYVSGELVIEAGVLVCLGPDAAITWRPGSGGTLVATGTAEAPVVFTADRPGGQWGGIVSRTSPSTVPTLVDLAHVVIEDAKSGIDLGFAQTARITDGVVRRIAGPGVRAGAVHLRGVVVDSACQSGGSCAAVAAPNSSVVVLDDVWIRDSGGGGLGMGDRGSLSLANVRITGSQDIGLAIHVPHGRGGGIGDVVHPIHIAGGGGRPAYLPATTIPKLLPSLEAQERWTGNADDVITVYNAGVPPGETPLAGLVVGPHLAWELTPWTFFDPLVVPDLTLLPGARFSGGLVQRITAEGTADAPIVIRGTRVVGSEAGPSRIAHARLMDVTMESGEAHALEMSDVLTEAGSVSLGAGGSRLERVYVRGAVRISAGDVVLEQCEVARSPSDGIRVEVADGVRIRDCNIEHNAGFGLRNLAGEAVDARDNWWGDAAGPLDAEGNGVEGAVDFEPFRTTPVHLDAPRPRSLTLTPSAHVVPVGDTASFTAEVLDNLGLPLGGEALEWRSSDTTTVVVDGVGSGGRVTGASEGTAGVTVVVRSDTTLRETVTVQVVAGAPPYRWTQLAVGAYSLWGDPEVGVYLTGDAGIHHFDGSRWELKWSLQEIGSNQIMSIGGLARDDLWATGTSALFRWDGTAWHRMPAPFSHAQGVWVAAPNQVYVVSKDEGANRGLWYYDGATYRQLLAENVSRVWGRSPTDVFVGTSSGTRHFDGTTWRNTGPPGSARAFWGTADLVFSVNGSNMYRYDGDGWERLDCEVPHATQLHGIWGTSPNNIYVAGNSSVVRHYDGTRCRTVWLGTDTGFSSVWGLGSDIVVGGWTGSYHGTPWE